MTQKASSREKISPQIPPFSPYSITYSLITNYYVNSHLVILKKKKKDTLIHQLFVQDYMIPTQQCKQSLYVFTCTLSQRGQQREYVVRSYLHYFAQEYYQLELTSPRKTNPGTQCPNSKGQNSSETVVGDEHWDPENLSV